MLVGELGLQLKTEDVSSQTNLLMVMMASRNPPRKTPKATPSDTATNTPTSSWVIINTHSQHASSLFNAPCVLWFILFSNLSLNLTPV